MFEGVVCSGGTVQNLPKYEFFGWFTPLLRWRGGTLWQKPPKWGSKIGSFWPFLRFFDVYGWIGRG